MDLTDVISERHSIGSNKMDINKDVIHIAFGIDENFTLGMGVLMTSILIHNKNKFIDFHIFTDRLKQRDIDRLQQLTEAYDNCTIHTYYVNSEKLKELPAWYIWTIAAWYRCLIAGELQDKNIEYVWYLDSDILCLHEINDLKLDSNDIILGANGMKMPKQEQERIKRFLQSAPYQSFNSGVLYINIETWVKRDITNKAFDAVTANPDAFGGLDGDAILYAVQQQWQNIDHKYNYGYNLIEDHHEIPNDKIFIHFAGTCKPWQAWGQDNKITDLWMEYKEKSPWKDVPLQMPKTYKQAKFMLKMMKRTGNTTGCIKWYFLYSLYKMKEKL